MAARMTQEMQGVEDGRQQILVRIPLDHPVQSDGTVEVTALVRVPTVNSNEQMEAAARQLAKLALEKALSAFPM